MQYILCNALKKMIENHCIAQGDKRHEPIAIIEECDT